MQPISLKLENFGPYENSLIDFSNFYAQSLFLITGKTGAGKTTIFDGMCYALYGSTSGGLRQGKEMRSNFAEMGKKTKVIFTFKQGQKTYEVMREPEQLVKKQRGEGFREQGAVVNLTVFDENKEEINQLTKQKDVGPFLSDLIQLNEQQFSQIVMLPQGEFRRFLNADSDSKEKVLRKLFNTYFYQNIADILRQKKKQQEANLKDIKQELIVLTAQLEWQKVFEEQKNADMYYQDVLALYEEQASVYKSETAELAKELETSNELVKKIQLKIQVATKLSELFKEQQELMVKLDKLNEQRPEINELKTYIETLNKVTKIEETIKTLSESKEQLEVTRRQEIELRNRIETNEADLKEKHIELEQLTLEEEQVKIASKNLQEIQDSIPLFEKKQLIDVQKKATVEQLSLLTKEKEILQKNLLDLEKKISDSKEFIKTKTVVIEERFSLEKQEAELIRKQEEVHGYLKECQKVTLLSEKLATFETEKIELMSTWQKKQEQQRQLKSDVARAQIAKLSLDLIEGEACVVCGSLDHPKPFHGQEISKEEMSALESSLETAEKEAVACKEQLIILEKEIAFKQEELVSSEKSVAETKGKVQAYFEITEKETMWLSSLNQLQEEVGKQLEAQRKLLLKIETEEKQLEELTKEHIKLVETISSQESRMRDDENKILQLNVSYEELLTRLPKTWQSVSEMKQEVFKLQNQVNTWEEAVSTLNETISNQTKQALIDKTNLENTLVQKNEREAKVQKEAEKVKTFLKDSNLDEETLNELIQNLEKLPTMENQVKAYEQETYVLEVNLKEVVSQLENKEEPDIKELLKEQEKITTIEKEQQERLTKLEYRMKQNQKILSTISTKEQEMKTDLEELEELSELTNVLTGDGGNKLSMERFVLQTYLKRILERANEKLVLLTHGRYQFELKEEQGSFKKKTGLEINIFDDNVGSLRGVNTLSGGESFIAALSLALSLAEVIQEEAGGIKIDAMFIDEGFGSLDEDALEMAIRSLESIEGDGRLIGIISHVRELKERIPQQLQIKSTLDGKSYVEERLEFE